VELILFVADIAGVISSPDMYNMRVVIVNRGSRIIREVKSLQTNMSCLCIKI
jgi:hypothetical protein